MDQQNQAPDPNDEQTAIAAMRLLARNLPASQREKMFAILAREQEEYTQTTPLEQQSDATATEPEQLVYPVQPLMLGSEDGHAASSESTTEAPTAESNADLPFEFHEDIGTERRYEERIPFAPFLLPLAASFSPRQWLGRFLVCALFLLALSLSTLMAYNAGVQTSSTNAPTAQPAVSSCTQSYVITHRHILYMRVVGQQEVGAWVASSPNGGNSSVTLWSYQGGVQCGGFYHRGFGRPFFQH